MNHFSNKTYMVLWGAMLLLMNISSFANFEVNESYPVHEIKEPIIEGQRYVDVIIVNYRGSGKDWRDIKKLFLGSRSHFKKAGVHLNLVNAVEIKLKRKFRRHSANDIDGVDPRPGLQPYAAMKIRKTSLHERAKEIFEKLTFLTERPENTLFTLISEGIFYKAFYTRDGQRVTLNKGVQGFSFPAYSFEDRIPHHLRGFVSIKPDVSSKTLSHEFGHKLINVSHEGLETCPKFSGGGVPGLMGYSGSTQIFEGKKGRYHKERLHLSPFVYKIINGKRIQNLDYQENGHYRDPIYKGKFFLTPECP